VNRLDLYKMAFGFAVVVIIAALAGIIAVEHVEEKTSYGLPYLLGSLTTALGGFTGWAFTKSEKEEK
jgi:hypothetical protein